MYTVSYLEAAPTAKTKVIELLRPWADYGVKQYFAFRGDDAKQAEEIVKQIHIVLDVVSVLRRGRVAATGGPELADELEETGYAGYREEDEAPAEDAQPSEPPDPFADPLA